MSHLSAIFLSTTRLTPTAFCPALVDSYRPTAYPGPPEQLLRGSQEIARFTPSSWTFSSAAESRTTRGVHSACTCKHAPACTADERWELSSSFRCRAIDWAG